MSTEKKTFSSKRKHETIDIDGQEYVVVSMTGAMKEEWQEKIANRYEIAGNDPANSVMKNYRGFYWDLISVCVFKVLPGSSRQPVSEEAYKEWDGDMCDQLYELCREVCGLNREGSDEAKKDSTIPKSSPGS